MNKQSLITLVFLAFFGTCVAQSTDIGITEIKVPLPKSWKNKSDLEVSKNLFKFDFEEKDLQNMLAQHNSNIPVAIYMKYDPSEYAGIIPTIQVNLRPNNTPNFDIFKAMMQQSMSQMGDYFKNFEVISPMQDIMVGGIKGVMFLAKFNLTNGVDVWTIRSWTYAVPVGDYFYQINFSDTADENCEDLYNELLKDIEFIK